MCVAKTCKTVEFDEFVRLVLSLLLPVCIHTVLTSTVWVKKYPVKLVTMFSFVVSMCNWKLHWLLPKHVFTLTPILVYLFEYLYELYQF